MYSTMMHQGNWLSETHKPLAVNFCNLPKRDSFELYLHEQSTSSTQTRLNSYDKEDPGEKVEPVLPLHAVWNKHKEIQLMDAEPLVKATQIISV